MSADHVRLANGVLWPGFFGTEAPDWLVAELREGLAGVVYFGQNVGDDLAAMSTAIRAAGPSALIGIDEEGGSVTRLEASSGSTLPGAAQLGALDDPAATRATGAELARRVREIGAHVVLGPVADVNTDPRNPVIGVRAFGSDPELVSRHVVAEVEGIQAAGAAACVKHFPGHGDTHLDSHHALPVVDLDPDELARTHLPPFRAAIDAGVDAIMTAHIVVRAWGAEPATLNSDVLGMLRGWGFDGVIITDALDMAAVRETVGIGQGAVRALAAGADLLCIGNPTNPGAAALPDQDEVDFRSARDAIVAALDDGSLSADRVREAGARVAALAEKLRDRREPADTVFAADDIVRNAIAVRGPLPDDVEAVCVVDARTRASLAIDAAGGYVSAILADGGQIVRVSAAGITDTDTLFSTGGDVTTVVLVDRPETDAAQRALIEQAAASDPRAVVVNVGLPALDPLPLTTIDVAAASALGARAARDILRGN